MSKGFRHWKGFAPLTLVLGFTAPGAAEDAAGHWAFRAIARPEAPAVTASDRVSNPIDAFVLARLEREGLGLSPPAGPAILFRRLSLDLTGLPPAPEEIRAFLAAWEADPDTAWRDAVERRLDSPHFGEQWGRHWLDMARYADSEGYLGDSERPWAWLYRDWVIDAINQDLPHDRFSIEQLAGDLLEKPTLGQRVATGFHRNTLRNTEAGVDLELYRTKEIVDRVNTTGTVWLGLTMACAECHDHKHDPLTQADFYGLYAFFNNADETTATLPMTPELERYADSQLSEKDRKKDPKPKLAARASVFTERTRDRRESYIHLRGDYQSRGDTVSPGTPAMLPPLSTRGGEDAPDRLDLARWLFDEENPLTARVAANQIWQHLFGVGIVPTPDDFGTGGAPPTHPELLDWLAREYRRLGWSRKEMIRLIVMSSTYRQSSDLRDGLGNHPTGNAPLWRQNRFRVSAETVRDAHLAASGLLDRKIGGPGIRPPLPAFVTEVGRTVAWPVSEGGERYRRGCYILLKRTVLYPMLTTFDAPDTSLSCSRREHTESPMQALTLLNDPVFFECAEALGRSVRRAHGDDVDAAIDDLFVRCLNREPTAPERDTLRSAHADFSTEAAADPDLAMIATARVVMNLDEFVSRP
ncbi:MAG: DUF1553 domain-containing protein [Verrucomicrobiae bacterium]|nr:DUF1553 domain-containing protein [Verrucomicrobiae bacterium]